MKRLSSSPAARRRASHGFTLAELAVASAVGSIVTTIALGGMVQGMHLFKSNATEMIARDKGSRATRRISTDIQQAAKVQIFPGYQSTTNSEGQYGSCVVLQKTSGGSVAYYRYAPNSDPNSGGIYFDSNAATAPNPATDKLLVNSVQDLEFRRDVNGSIRVGFSIGTLGYPTKSVGSKESDRVRFTTSNVPRNL